MSTFPLRIGTPDGLLYEGEVARLVCRTINGDLAILPRHCNYCTALGMGEAHIILEDGSRKNAACIGGMLSVMNGTCHVLATTWEWEEDIDTERAEDARKRAKNAGFEEISNPAFLILFFLFFFSIRVQIVDQRFN